MVYVGRRKYPYGRMLMSHMIATDLEELHAMADEIGVARKHFQDKPGRPHYDICQSKRSLALQHGALGVSESTIIHILKQHY